jgi:hypothetical protein
MAWALPVHPVLKKFGDVPDDPTDAAFMSRRSLRLQVRSLGQGRLHVKARTLPSRTQSVDAGTQKGSVIVGELSRTLGDDGVR